MNKKQLTVAITIFIVLLVVSLLTLRKEDSSWTKGTLADKIPLIKDFDVNQVAKFAIFDGHKTATIVIKDDKWVVLERNSYPADFTRIQDFLLKIQELKIAQKIRLKKSGFGKLKLIPPTAEKENLLSGIQLTFSNNKDIEISSMTLGEIHISKKENPNPFAPPFEDGRYMLVKGAAPVLIADSLTEVKPNPALWLDKNFIKTFNLKSLTMSSRSGKQQWCIKRDKVNSPYALLGVKNTEQPNPRKMQEITSACSQMQFLDVLPEDTDKKKIGLEKPATLVLKTFDGITYNMQFGVKKKRAFAKFAILADLPKKRVPGKNEKPERKDKLNKAFEANLKSVNEKLAKEKFFTNWIYELPLGLVKKILVTQQELVVEKQQLPMMLGQ